jgi:hypothetical protein
MSMNIGIMSVEKTSVSRKFATVFPLTETFLGKSERDFRLTDSLLGKSAPILRLSVAVFVNTGAR